MKTITIGEIREKIANQIEAARFKHAELLSREKASLEFTNAKSQFEQLLEGNNERKRALEALEAGAAGLSKDIEDMKARLVNATPEALGPWTEELQAGFKRLEAIKAKEAEEEALLEADRKKIDELAARMAAAKGTISLHDAIDMDIARLQALLKPKSGALSSKLGLHDLSPNKKLWFVPSPGPGHLHVGKAEIGARVDGVFTEWIGVTFADSGDVLDWAPVGGK